MAKLKAMKVLVWMVFFMLGVKSVTDAFDGLDHVIALGDLLDLFTQGINMDTHRFTEGIGFVVPAFFQQLFGTDDAFLCFESGKSGSCIPLKSG